MKLDQLGQTSIEYILMIVVSVTLAVGFFQKLDTFLLSGNQSFVQRYLGGFSQAFGGQNGSFQGQYRYFRLRR